MKSLQIVSKVEDIKTTTKLPVIEDKLVPKAREISKPQKTIISFKRSSSASSAATTTTSSSHAEDDDPSEPKAVKDELLEALTSGNSVTGVEFTVTFKIRITASAGEWRSIFHKGTTDGDRTPAVWLHCSNDSLHCRISTNVNGNDGFDTKTQLKHNKWYHVAYVVYGFLFAVFIDGKLDTVHRLNGTVLWNNGPWHTASSHNFRTFTGQLKELRYYNIALNSAQLQLDAIQEQPLESVEDQPVSVPRLEKTNLGRDLGELLKTGKHGDVELHIEGKKVMAHKVILATRSKYFDTMFNSGMQEAEAKIPVVAIPEVPYNLFMLILEYIYTGGIDNDEAIKDLSTLLQLIRVANEYLLTDMEGICVNKIQKLLNKDNACQLAAAAYELGADAIVEKAMRVIVTNLAEVCTTDHFLEMPKEVLKEVFNNAKKNSMIHE